MTCRLSEKFDLLTFLALAGWQICRNQVFVNWLFSIFLLLRLDLFHLPNLGLNFLVVVRWTLQQLVACFYVPVSEFLWVELLLRKHGRLHEVLLWVCEVLFLLFFNWFQVILDWLKLPQLGIVAVLNVVVDSSRHEVLDEHPFVSVLLLELHQFQVFLHCPFLSSHPMS